MVAGAIVVVAMDQSRRRIRSGASCCTSTSPVQSENGEDKKKTKHERNDINDSQSVIRKNEN